MAEQYPPYPYPQKMDPNHPSAPPAPSAPPPPLALPHSRLIQPATAPVPCHTQFSQTKVSHRVLCTHLFRPRTTNLLQEPSHTHLQVRPATLQQTRTLAQAVPTRHRILPLIPAHLHLRTHPPIHHQLPSQATIPATLHHNQNTQHLIQRIPRHRLIHNNRILSIQAARATKDTLLPARRMSAQDILNNMELISLLKSLIPATKATNTTRARRREVAWSTDYSTPR